jgi:hypothetical protein
MGLEAVYQKPNTNQPNPQHKVYPYLLRGLSVDRCDQVWSTFHHLCPVFDFYNHERFHQSLDYRTPAHVYLGRQQASEAEEDFYQPASILIR